MVKAKAKSKTAHPKRARKKPARKAAPRYKTISISVETHKRMVERMVYSDTFDGLIGRLLDVTPGK